MNKNQFEYCGLAFNVKESQTSNGGWMYKLSIPLVTGELKEYLSGIIFTKEKVELPERCEVHLIAKLEVQAAYATYPQRLGFVGFKIEQIFQKAFGKKQSESKPEAKRFQKQDAEANDYVPF